MGHGISDKATMWGGSGQQEQYSKGQPLFGSLYSHPQHLLVLKLEEANYSKDVLQQLSFLFQCGGL